ncbi:survival motor neuron protein-like [Pempheris klunzingeri]|uniref:survival motor neuron protein-like n=1 Tax=Pempheris klunzingeri TaxID=3127111 RepID=UPI00397F4B63
MTEVTGNTDESATVQQQTSLIEAFENTLEISQDFEQTECAASEETDGKQTSEQQDGQTVCAAAAEPSGTESKWGVGARCQVRWSEDGQVYLATVVSLDGERCRVHFNGYGNEEDVELSELRSPDGPHTHRHNPQDWGPGSRCRAVYSEDGLVYPAVVLWVKGQRCRIRFDDYNNEEEQDVDGLLRLDELRGPGRAAVRTRTWTPTRIPDWVSNPRSVGL